MSSKIIRLFLKDRLIILGAVLFAFLCVCAVALWKIGLAQERTRSQLQEKKELADRIPYFMNLLKLEEKKQREWDEMPHFTINGFLFDSSSNRSSAVINGEVFYENDVVDHFIIKKITKNAVILENRTTGKLTTLPFQSSP